MPTKEEIIARHKTEHDDLSHHYYVLHEIDKVAFDLQHGQNWTDMDTELIAGGFKQPPVPRRNIEAEIDDLKIQIAELKEVQHRIL